MSAPALSGLSLQPRDLALLRDLLESRVMTAAHLSVLHFAGRKEAAKKRLQTLKSAGLLAERPRKAYEPAVLFLTRKALGLLQQRAILAAYPALDLPALERRARVSTQTVQHELEIMDVKCAVHAAVAATQGLALEEFTTWPLLYQFEAFRPGYHGQEVTVKPDGFLRIHEKGPEGGLFEHTFFLEVDRSTETLDTLLARAGSYLDHYKSGGFAASKGAPRSAFRDYPFRVLMVFRSAERRNNFAERLVQGTPPILTHVWLATFVEATAQPLAAIWLRPLDYREAMKGTAFDCERRSPSRAYQRQTERDLLVQRAVSLCCLRE